MEGKSCVHIGDGGRINKVANSGSGLVGWLAGWWGLYYCRG